jgi:hypothetical protein
MFRLGRLQPIAAELGYVSQLLHNADNGTMCQPGVSGEGRAGKTLILP